MKLMCAGKVAALAMVVTGSVYADPVAERLDTLMTQWVSLEKQQDQLVYDWQQQQLVLQQRLSLLELEKGSLTEQLEKHSGGSISGAKAPR